MRSPGISIRDARAEELEALRDIESAAGRLFIGVGMTFVADDPPPPVELLRGHQQAGLAWVAVDPDDQPIAYLLADRVDGNAHIEQVSVHPSGTGESGDPSSTTSAAGPASTVCRR